MAHDSADDAVLSYWTAGKNTADIASLLGLPESEVANRLPRLLARRRVQRAAEKRAGIRSAIPLTARSPAA